MSIPRDDPKRPTAWDRMARREQTPKLSTTEEGGMVGLTFFLTALFPESAAQQ
jgi:hypothetical protein